MKIVYVNGAWVEAENAKISIFDRGFLFADSVYEVTAFINGQVVDYTDHYDRLLRSCGEMGFSCPLSKDDFLTLHKTLMHKNNISEGVVYLQISRGVAERNFIYTDSLKPTIIAFPRSADIVDHPLAKTGIKVSAAEDLRWARCDIKTTQLTAQSLTKTKVIGQGFDDAWMVRDGLVTEGTSNNAFIVNDQDQIITRPLSVSILGGVTRKTFIALANALGYDLIERTFSVDEVWAAQEAFSTSTSTVALPVIEFDGKMIGNGKPGPVFSALRDAYLKRLDV